MQREKRNGVWRMLLCGSKRRKMSQSMIATSLLCVLISVAIAVCAIGYFTFQLVVGEKGKARVDVLQQISDSNSVNRTNMVKAMDALYEDFYDDLTAPKSEKSSSAIQMLLEQTNRQFKRIGMDMTIDILMNDRRMFSTDPDENNLKSLKNTYWTSSITVVRPIPAGICASGMWMIFLLMVWRTARPYMLRMARLSERLYLPHGMKHCSARFKSWSATV